MYRDHAGVGTVDAAASGPHCIARSLDRGFLHDEADDPATEDA